MAKRVILDVDTGSDDAIAILCAILSPELEVEAICTTWGNTTIENTTDNTLRLLSRIGSEIPVYRGAHTALAKYLSPERDIDGSYEAVIDDELVKMHDDHLKLPESRFIAQSLPAVFFYIDYLSATTEDIHIVATGPLSNLGMALAMEPSLVKKISSLTIMGGGYNVTNVTPFAEANFWSDPEAAQIVLDSGIEPLIVPLDATHKAIITQAEIDQLKSQGNFCSEFSASLLEQRLRLHKATTPLEIVDATTVHDALAVAALINEDFLNDVRAVKISMVFAGSAEGHCVLDRRERPDEANCRFAFSSNRDMFVSYLIHTLAKGA